MSEHGGKPQGHPEDVVWEDDLPCEDADFRQIVTVPVNAAKAPSPPPSPAPVRATPAPKSSARTAFSVFDNADRSLLRIAGMRSPWALVGRDGVVGHVDMATWTLRCAAGTWRIKALGKRGPYDFCPESPATVGARMQMHLWRGDATVQLADRKLRLHRTRVWSTDDVVLSDCEHRDAVRVAPQPVDRQRQLAGQQEFAVTVRCAGTDIEQALLLVLMTAWIAISEPVPQMLVPNGVGWY